MVAIYSTFLQRAYDQLIHDVALQNLPVVFAIDRAGLVGSDGATHQGSYDLSFLSCIPNLTIMAPSDENECRQMLHTATTLGGPAAVRYPRGVGSGVAPVAALQALPVGKAVVRREGHSGLVLLSFGTMLQAALAAAEPLDASVLDMRFVKPLDSEAVVRWALRSRALVTLEENALAGGAGSAVAECLDAAGVLIPRLAIGIADCFIEHGTRQDCLIAAGLDAATVVERIAGWWAVLNSSAARLVRTVS